MRQKDLVPLLGGRSRVSEVLVGKRPLTLVAAGALSDALHIPADLLVRAPAATYCVKSNARVPPQRCKAPCGLNEADNRFHSAEAWRILSRRLGENPLPM